MPLFEYLCIDGQEVAHAHRAATYVRNRSSLGSVIFTVSSECFDCPIVDDGDTYSDPATDDAPWYDSAVQASEEFLGVAPVRMELLAVTERPVTKLARGGGVIGPLVAKPRTMTVSGLMFAYTSAGMSYGQRWLSEVLAGQNCAGTCTTSEVEFLPACPSEDTETYEPDLFFRRLVDAACIDGPVFSAVTKDLPECYVSQVAFQIMAGNSHIYSPEIACLEDEPMSTYTDDPTCCLLSTTDWTGDAVANITITAQSDATDIVLTGSPTFDGACPWDGNPPCWTLTIPELPEEGIITVDSVRGQVRYRDPARKVERSGVRMVDFEGPLTFPEIGPCSEFCICGTVGTGDVTMSVSKVIREF